MPFDPTALASELPNASAYERAIIDGLQHSIGFDVAFFASLGETPTTVGLDASTLERAFSSRAYDHELVPLKAAALGARGVAVDTQVFGESEVQRRAYFRDFAAPVGGRHSLVAYLTLRGRPLGVLMLGRGKSSFSARDVTLVESLLPRMTVGRASFHAPFIGEPLRKSPETSMVARALSWTRGQRVLARVDRTDGSILIRDTDKYREMVAVRANAELIWSRAELGDPRRSGWFYVDLFHLAACRARRRRNALFIGCGGAVAVRQFAEVYPGISIDLVDIDPAVIELARDWYGLGSIPQLTVHVADGFDFVERTSETTYDVIIVDAYDASDLPDRIAGRPFFRQVRRVLRQGGCMAFNAIGALAGSSSVQRVERAARAELDHVRLVPVLDPDETYTPTAQRNIIILGSA